MWTSVTVPKLIQIAYPKRIWSLPKEKDQVFLTFDDGPIPDVTPWVLSELQRYEAKATFFCIGDNIRKHPEIFQQVIADGHAIGNHTQHHLNGWNTSFDQYIEEVAAFEETFKNNTKLSLSLFRPPYGKITSKQARQVLKEGYQIVMWSILSYDYDTNVSEEQCLQNVLKYLKPGAIVVFHDSLKAEKNLRQVLPKVLETIQEKGWNAASLKDIL